MQVDNCGSLQGRAYLMRQVGAPPRHLAALCFDADRAVAARLRTSSAPHDALGGAAHSDRAPPLSLLGNFNHMFDASTRHAAERLYGDDARMNRRLHELLKHEHYSFAEQSLTSAELLSSHYFEDQNMRAAAFVSNRVAVWRSVARGNLQHVQRDVARLLSRSRPHAALSVHAGTHGVLSLRTGHSRTEIFLKAGNRFPVPKYIWTVVHAEQAHKAVALVLLNDPFVAVSEVRDAVFCESACGRVAWLHELRRQRRYESPLYGLVFCCSLSNFTSVVTELPEQLIDVSAGNAGMLTDLFD